MMFVRSVALMGAVALALAGCSDSSLNENDAAYAEADYAEAEMLEVAAAPAEDAVPSQQGEIPTSEPQIAYTYSLGFKVPLGSIKALQKSHAKMCEEMGSGQCRIIDMNQSSQSADYASGQLRIAVTADKAPAFADTLEASTGEADGELTSSSLSGEDLSKSIIDTEARLRSRELLRDRLTEILASRSGSVGELVEAERAVAQVNQEIDQARSWLETMRNRVAFSDMTIRYNAGEPSAVSGGFMEPIISAWNSLGGILGGTIAALMMAFAALVPITAAVLALRWVLHRFGYRLRFWKTDLREAANESSDPVS